MLGQAPDARSLQPSCNRRPKIAYSLCNRPFLISSNPLVSGAVYPFGTHQLNPYMNPLSFRPRFIFRLCFASLGVASLLALRSFAAPPPVTVAQPVQVQVVNTDATPAQVQVVGPIQGTVGVQGPVQVQGAVEVLNDALRIPYNKTVQTNDPNPSVSYMSFPVPTGKRLVIKTIGLQCTVSSGHMVFAGLTETSGEVAPGGFYLPLVFQSSGLLQPGITTYTTTISTDISFDRKEGYTPTIQLNYTNGGVSPVLVASVSGYLIDL